MEPRFLIEFLKIIKHPKRKALSFSIRSKVDADEGVSRTIFKTTKVGSQPPTTGVAPNAIDFGHYYGLFKVMMI